MTQDEATKARLAAADKAVTRAAVKIERAITDLFDRTGPLYEVVARQYVIERLIDALIERNPAALDYLNRGGDGSLVGDASMRLANALMDWRDQWRER